MGFLQKPQVTHTKVYRHLWSLIHTTNSEDQVPEVPLSAGSNTINSHSEMLRVLIQQILKIAGRLQYLENNLQVTYKILGVFVALDYKNDELSMEKEMYLGESRDIQMSIC